jgi:agmatine/peptidylarginine deiminase
VKSSNAVILTDKIIRENQYKYKKHELIDELHKLFEVEKVILIPADDECIYGHADGMLRFIDDDTVLISGFYYQDEYYRNKITKALKSNRLKYEWLRIQPQEPALNISYINFLQTKDMILVPQLKRKNQDMKALEEIRKYYADNYSADRVIGVEVKEITRQGGALNCISWTILE